MFVFLLLVNLACCKVFPLTDIPSSAKQPPLRAFHILTYISKEGILALFGGNLSVDKFYNDLWTFNLTSLKWQEVVSISSSVPSNPYTGGRISFGSFYDEFSNSMFIFGGNTPYGLQSDMWRFDFDTLQWSIVYPVSNTSTNPEALYRFGYTSYSIDSTTYFAIYGGKVFKGFSKSLHVYNSRTNEWKNMPRTETGPPELIFSCLQYYQGMIFLACGENPGSSNDRYSTSTYAYNLTTQTWNKLNLNNSFEHRTYSASVLIGSWMYIIYGYNGNSQTDVESIQKLNLASPSSWENLSLKDDIEIVRDSFAAVEASNKIYITCGYISLEAKTLNDLVEINPTKLSFQYLSNTELQPSSRMLHSMEVINGKLYIFGGFTDSGLTNELWKFDPELLYWELVQVQGTNPVARCMHGSDASGDIMVVWGGLSDSGNLADMHYYNALNNRWTEVQVDGLKPSARRGACIEVSLPYVFIFGGRTSEGYSSELWAYEAGKNIYSKLYYTSNYALPVMNHLCDSEVIEDTIVLYSFTGSTTGENPVLNLRQFNISSNLSKVSLILLADESDDSLQYTNPIGIRLGRDFMIMGGQRWMTEAWRRIYLANPGSNKYSFISDSENIIENYIWGSAFVYYKEMIYSHGGGTQMGSSIRPVIPTGKLYLLNISLYCEMFDNKCKPTCSPGTFLNSKSRNCETCSKGSYSEGFGNTQCKLCAEGTYNMYDGANTQEQCYPCPEGYFNSFKGQSLCLACPPGSSCPSGSRKPSYSEFTTEIKSQQPASFVENSAKSKEASRVFSLTFMSFCLLGIILIVIFRDKLFPVIQKLDIYMDGHNYRLYSEMKLKKTIIGGIFTLIFILVAILLIITTIIEFEFNNLTEKKTLIPLAIIYDQVESFESNIEVKLTLMRYGGTCDKDLFERKEFSIKTSMIDGRFDVISISGPGSDDCSISFYCKKCSLSVGAAFEFLASEKSSYASALALNISATSSIESEKSSLYFLIKTPQNSIFRGSKPTVFKISAIPSLFRKGINGKDHTGYHFSVSSEPENGSYYTTQEIAFTANLNVKIEFELSESSLFTLRFPIETEIYMINALLGSVFGILSAAKVAMKLVEISGKFANDLLKRYRNRQDIINKRINLKDQIMLKKDPARVYTIYDSFFQTEPLSG